MMEEKKLIYSKIKEKSIKVDEGFLDAFFDSEELLRFKILKTTNIIK